MYGIPERFAQRNSWISHRSNRWNSHRVCVFGRHFRQRLLIYNAKRMQLRSPKHDFSRSIDLIYAIFRENACANLFGITSITHSLWKNYSRSILEVSEHFFSVVNFFSSKNVWGGVTTCLWEREIWHLLPQIPQDTSMVLPSSAITTIWRRGAGLLV